MPKEIKKAKSQGGASLRKPPHAGGSKRIGQAERQFVSEQQSVKRAQIEGSFTIPPRSQKQSKFRKALPYIVAGGSTGVGIGAALTGFLS